ncbi:MAG TPA: alpha/beta fold hydrolase [Gemmatimonadaceae bacterium]
MLLDAAHVARPLVLVGHSVGGINVRVYAERYGSDVAGMVLVDPTHESTVLYNTRRASAVRTRRGPTGEAAWHVGFALAVVEAGEGSAGVRPRITVAQCEVRRGFDERTSASEATIRLSSRGRSGRWSTRC